VVGWKFLWKNSAPGVRASDPSVVISTFITIYVLFLTGFGVLIGLITAKKDAREVWKPVAIAFLIVATAMDLWRMLDSTNDLYNAATSGLSYHALHDTIHDFFAYFVLNVFVIAVAVLAVCLPPRPPKNTPAAILRQKLD
jgi:hypothetical protein